MAEVRVRQEELDGQPVTWREADGGDPPVLYVHGVPTLSSIWEDFLAVTGGLAPDMPGFGASGKRADLPYDLPFYDRWLERFLDARGIDRVRLVVQDWGAGFGLAWAQRFPERVERLVVMDAVPLLPGYRWHRIARVWRTPVAGEVFMGLTNRPTLSFISRESNATKGPMPRRWLDPVIGAFDAGTQRAILRLYRWADPEALAAAGRDLGRVTCPALVLWGEQDPYVGPEFAQAYADALGGPAEVEVLPDAGHWPWYDRPDLVERVRAFLDA